MNSERERFEVWFKANMNRLIVPTGYVEKHAWEAWQAALESVVPFDEWYQLTPTQTNVGRIQREFPNFPEWYKNDMQAAYERKD